MNFQVLAPWAVCAGLAAVALRPAPTPTAPAQQPTGGPQLTGTSIVPPAFGSSDSNGSMIAVTGPDVTGGGVLYVIDTDRHQLACYQATGGSSTAGLRFLGARNIDLDLQVLSYNDSSKLSVQQLEKEFDKLNAAAE